MKLRQPINVVMLSPFGVAENVGCAGPEQLKNWLDEGRVTEASHVYVEKDSSWMSVETYLYYCGRRSDTEQLDEMAVTMTNLLDVAEELKRLARIRDGDHRQRNVGKHRKAVGPDGDADDHDGDDCATIRSTGAGAYAH